MAAGGDIAWFGDEACHEVRRAGGKGASLSRMVGASLRVPPGFVVCASAFARVLDVDGVRRDLERLLDACNPNDMASLGDAASAMQHLVVSGTMPDDLANDIATAYARLGADGGDDALPVAVRSSAIAEDSAGASFAGQQATFLNVVGAAEVVAKVRECWASFFGTNALFYRAAKGSLADTAMAVVVQRMINPDRSGVLFTADAVQHRRDRFVVEATWGLGEAVVSGLVVPDNYVLDRSTGALLSAYVPPKTVAIVRDAEYGGTREIPVPPEQAETRVLADDDLRRLWNLGQDVETFFGAPQDIEWGIEADDLFLLQSRPITTL